MKEEKEKNNNQLPNDWKWVKLGESGKIISGGTPSTAISEYWNGKINWIAPSDLTGYNDKTIQKGKKSITESGLRNSSARLMPKGSVLFSSRAPIGYVVIADAEVCTNQGFKSIIPNENVSSDFLYYFLLASKRNAEQVASGTTFKEISLSKFSELNFPLPPKPTQEVIVSKIEELFSELDKGIENLHTAQQQLKTYRQSVLKWAFEGKLSESGFTRLKDEQDLVNKEILQSSNSENPDSDKSELPKGWKMVKIGDVCKCIVPNRDKPKSFTGEIKWITTPNLSEKSIRLNYENVKLGLSENEVREYNARVIPVDGVIMTCVGTFGLSAIVEKPIVINQQLHAFITNDNVYSKFLAYCIQLNKQYFESKSTSTTIQYLNKENCNSMPFPLCSIEEQHKIVQAIESRLSVADKMEESITQSLQQAEALRQSILKKAFEGRLI